MEMRSVAKINRKKNLKSSLSRLFTEAGGLTFSTENSADFLAGIFDSIEAAFFFFLKKMYAGDLLFISFKPPDFVNSFFIRNHHEDRNG